MRLPGSLVPDPDLRTAGHGRFLIGGSPTTVLTLSTTGAATVRSWFAGRAAPSTDAERRLADRLEAVGVAWRAGRRPSGRRAPTPLAVVIPVRDDAAGLDTTLRGLAAADRRPDEVVVVDDASVDADAVTGAARRWADLGLPVRVERRPSAGGPAVARNTGVAASRVVDAAAAGSSLVVIDAGVALDPDTLGALEQAVHDGALAAAPRIRSTPVDSALGRYEAVHSPLDLGDRSAVVRPGGRVAYVPSTALALDVDAVRRRIDEVGWLFDPALRFGEDVDLVWRLAEVGTVRYLADLGATHPPRSSWWALARQRFGYGSAAGPLAERHGAAVTPLRLGRASAVGVAALSLPGVALPVLATAAAIGAPARRVAATLPDELPDRGRHALAMVGRGHRAALTATGAAALRAWWPVLAVAALIGPPPLRRLARRFLALGLVRRVPGGPVAVIGGVADDVAYGTGVWRSALRTRRRARSGALRPVIGS